MSDAAKVHWLIYRVIRYKVKYCILERWLMEVIYQENFSGPTPHLKYLFFINDAVFLTSRYS